MEEEYIFDLINDSCYRLIEAFLINIAGLISVRLIE